MSLSGQVALVTGGGTGIGKAIAQAMLAEGAKIIIVGRKEEVLKEAQTELGSGVEIMVNQKSGRIINIGSISGQMGRPENAPYTATKFAIEGLTRAFALDGRDHGIAVSVIHPGNAATNIWKGREEVSEREGLIPLEDLVKLAVTMLTMSPNVNILGSVILPITQPYLGRG